MADDTQTLAANLRIPKDLLPSEQTLWLYNNPLNIQLSILSLLEDKLQGKYFIADPNNSFMFMLEGFSNVVGDIVFGIQQKFNSLFPLRAQSIYDLLQHLSDYDYLGVYALPASIKVNLILDKNHLVNNGIQDPNNPSYKYVRIPKNTEFKIGNFTFGIYYPILIKINTITNNVIVEYDISQYNPLKHIKDLTITKQEVTYGNKQYLILTFPIYQFTRTVVEAAAPPGMAFVKKLSYQDKFYAIRVFTKDPNNPTQWKELSLTFSEFNYDPNKATAKIVVDTDLNEVQIEVPQIYFTNNLVSNNFKIELYTTLGQISTSLSDIDPNSYLINFSKYATEEDLTSCSILKTCPTVMLKLDKFSLVGGADGIDFDTFKKQILYTYHTAPITEPEIEILFLKYNFNYKKRKDDLTERIFYAIKPLILDPLTPIKTANIKLAINPNKTYYGILYKTDKIVITPNAIFDINYNSLVGEALTTELYENFINKPLEEFTNEVNTKNYMFTPFVHIIKTDPKYPEAFAVNFTPEITDVKFEKDNQVFEGFVDYVEHHLTFDYNTNTFIIRIAVTPNEIIKKDANQILPVLKFISKEGYTISCIGTFLSQDDQFAYYEFTFKTTYDLTTDDIEFETDPNNTVFLSGLTTNNFTLPNPCFMYLDFFIHRQNYPYTPNDPVLINDLPLDLQESYLAINRYSFNLKFFDPLTDCLLPNLTITFTEQKYATYEYDQPLQYEQDVYERDANGKLIYTITEDNKVQLSVLHQKGETVYDDQGNIVYKFTKDDVKLDENGNPIVLTPRTQKYTIELLTMDYKYKLISDVYSLIMDQFENIRTNLQQVNDNLIENTNAYYRSPDYKGLHEVYLNVNTKISVPLELGFNVKLLVPKYVLTDKNLQEELKNKITDIIKSYLIMPKFSLTEIAKFIKDNLQDLVDEAIITVKNYPDLQYFYNTDPSISFSLKELIQYNTSTGTFYLVPDIDFVFEEKI